MNDCIHKNLDTDICKISNRKCNFSYQEIKEGDCDEFENNYSKEDWQDLLLHSKMEN